MDQSEFNGLLLRARGLAAFRGVLDSGAGRGYLAVLELLAAGRPDPHALAGACACLWGELLADELPGRYSGDAWRDHLVGRILWGEHRFGRAAELGDPGPILMQQGRRELRVLRELFDLDAGALLTAAGEAVPELRGLWAAPAYPPESSGDVSHEALAYKLAAAEDWAELAEALAGHYAQHGAAPFGSHRAFRWDGDALKAVSRPDPVRLRTLIGYAEEREPLLLNTRRFLAGLPSHHALLYGLPGTGKSSTIKAVLNEYARKGLRLVELAKGDLEDLPRVLDALRDRGPRFILFIDDLSFEEHEVEYKSLKALLEGSIEEPPVNVRIYATSNRRNLIRESFSDREEDDVHARDTMQEKLSLAARFGLRLTFPAPDQQRYLKIVAGLVEERGLKIPGEELKERALLWDRWHAGRSGRTARQFVDELEAGLGE